MPHEKQEAQPRVSVVIVTWNGQEILKRCLPSVVQTQYSNLQIVVVDNASADDTVSWIRESHPAVDVIELAENHAFCGGNNRGLRYVDGDYVAFLNNDVEVPSDWLDALIERLEGEPDIAAIQPKLLQYEHRDRFEYAGAAGGFLDRLGYPFARGRLFYTVESDEGQYDDSVDISWTTGAAMLVRRSALPPGDPFDERFFMHMEEIDLCWRLRWAGNRVVCEPRSRVYHLGASSLAVSNPRKTYLNFRNNLLMLYKNTPPNRWRRLLVARFVLDVVAALHAVAGGRFHDFSAIVRAHVDARKLRRSEDWSRPTADAIDPGPVYRRSIVSDYFVRGLRRFSDLPRDAFGGR